MHRALNDDSIWVGAHYRLTWADRTHTGLSGRLGVPSRLLAHCTHEVNSLAAISIFSCGMSGVRCIASLCYCFIRIGKNLLGWVSPT